MLARTWALLSAVFAASLASAAPSPKLIVPNFPSFKIKTRVTFGTRPPSIHTLYLQGARTRAEYEHGASSRPEEQQVAIVNLTQCDQKRNLGVDPLHKTFTEWPILNWSERARRPLPPAQQTGPDASTSVDSVDTGEHLQVGPYVARHVKTTIRNELATNPTTTVQVHTIDGWYIDLPALDCQDWGGRDFSSESSLLLNPGQRVHYSHTGTGKRGYAVEEISETTVAGHSYQTRVELLETSSAGLDPQLFEVPPGYAHALQSPLGVDYSRPDTLGNRTAAYWTYFRQRMAGAFHSNTNCGKPESRPPASCASL